ALPVYPLVRRIDHGSDCCLCCFVAVAVHLETTTRASFIPVGKEDRPWLKLFLAPHLPGPSPLEPFSREERKKRNSADFCFLTIVLSRRIYSFAVLYEKLSRMLAF